MFVYRDPFARETLFRTRHYAPATCAWCGQAKQTPTRQRTYLFAYFTVTDGGRRHDVRPRFCSTFCFRAYHQH